MSNEETNDLTEEVSPVNPEEKKPIDWKDLMRSLVAILAIISAFVATTTPTTPTTDTTTVNVTTPSEPTAPVTPVVTVTPSEPVVAPVSPVNPTMPVSEIGKPLLKVPSEIKVEVGEFISITAETNTDWVNFKVDKGLNIFPPNLLSDKKSTVIIAKKEGVYTVLTYTGNDKGGIDGTTTIIVGTPPPVVVTPPVTDPTKPPVVTPPTTKPTAVTYVYEKDDTALEPAIMAALDQLNRTKGVKATLYEHDTPNGNDQVPEQYKAALAAGKSVGLPALVVTAGNVIIKSISKPTAEQVAASAD